MGAPSTKTILDIGVILVIVLMMMAVGMELERKQFLTLAKTKKGLLLALAGQTIILPALACGVAYAMALPPPIAAGLMLVAACPVGDIANFYILLARADLALSLSLNATTVILAPVTMGIVFDAYSKVMGSTFEYALPNTSILVRLLMMLIVPVSAGIALRRTRPEFVNRHRSTLRSIALLGIAYVLATVVVTQGGEVLANWQQTAAAAGVFMGMALAAGCIIGWLLKLNKKSCITIGVGFAVRNVAMATAIAFTILDRSDYAVFAALYFMTEVSLLLSSVGIYRWAKRGTVQRREMADPSA